MEIVPRLADRCWKPAAISARAFGVAEDPLIRNVASLRMDRLGDPCNAVRARVQRITSDCPPLQEIPEEGDPEYPPALHLLPGLGQG